MNNFQLFKVRDFSANISDCIAFFKIHGKHYFKNYLTINGVFLLLIMVLMYFIMKVYMEFIFSMTANPQNAGSSDYLSAYFNDNLALFLVTVIGFVLVALFLTIVSTTYPIVYLKYMEDNGDPETLTPTIFLNQLKQMLPRLLIFFLGLIFIVTPIVLIVFIVNVFLCFILIGIPLFFVTLPAITAWIALSLHEFIIKEVGFFESLGNGFGLLKQKFWSIVGTTLVVVVIMQILQGIITMIPYVIGIVILYASADQSQTDPTQTLSTMSILLSVIMMISILLSYLFNNFMLITQGLMYYSLREENEENNTKSQIDLIGTESE